MLGKLIKNEFINRGKQAASILIAFLCLGGVVALMGVLHDGGISNGFFELSYALLVGIFMTMIFVVIAALLIGSFQDFGKRFFKDQGYLTHTLPVKMSSLIIARMVFDLVLFVAMAVFIPIAICIAARDFEFFNTLGSWIRDMLARSSSGLDVSVVILDIILTFVAMLVYVLSSLWMFNASYAIGHAFHNAKRLMSVVAFGVISIINWIFTYIVGYVTVETDIMDILYSSTASDEVSIMISLLVMIAISVVSTAIYAVITSYVCKKRLNLE